MKLSRRQTRLLQGLGLALVLYTLGGFFLAPWVVRKIISGQVNQQWNGPWVLDKVRVNPFTFRLSLDTLSIKDDDEKPVVGFQHFTVRLSPASLFQRGWVIGDLVVTEPYLELELGDDGELNLLRHWIQPETTEGQTTTGEWTIPPLTFRRVQIIDGHIDLYDRQRTPDFEKTYRPIEFILTNFRTVATNDEPYVVEARTPGGEVLTWRGQLNLYPFHIDGEISLRGFDITNFAMYLSDFTEAELRSGDFAFKLRYRLEPVAPEPILQIDLDSVRVSQLALYDPLDGERFFYQHDFSIEGLTLDLIRGKLDANKLILTDGDIQAKRQPDGDINLIRLILDKLPEGAERPAFEPLINEEALPELEGNPAESLRLAVITLGGQLIRALSLPWEAELKEVSMSGQQLTWSDGMTEPKVELVFSDTQLKLESVSSVPGRPIAFTASTILQDYAELTATGEAVYDDVLDVDATLMLLDFPLSSVSGYLTGIYKGELRSGDLTVDGTLKARLVSDEWPDATFRGQLGVSGFALHLPGKEHPALAWKSLTMEGLEAETQPLAVAGDAMTIHGLRTEIIRQEDETFDLIEALPTQAELERAPARPLIEVVESFFLAKAEASPLIYRLDKLTLEDGALTYRDESLRQPFVLVMSDIALEAEGFDSTFSRPSHLTASSRLGTRGQASTTASVTPKGDEIQVEASIRLQDFDLIRLDAYSRDYLGYAMDRGQLGLDLNYTVSASILEGQNAIEMRSIRLGEATPGPKSTNLPVRLGLALLTDPNGNAQLRVPVRGNLRDPEFGLGQVIMSAFANILTRLLTSPFAMMGMMFGGGDDVNLERVEFVPGTMELGAEGREETLPILARALAERPALTLGVKGSAGGREDQRLLKRLALLDELIPLDEVNRLEQLKQAGTVHQEIPEKQERFRRLVEELFVKIYPDGLTPDELAEEEQASLDYEALAAMVPRTGGVITSASFGRRGGRTVAGPSATGTSASTTPVSAADKESAESDEIDPEQLYRQMEQRVLDRLPLPEGGLRALARARANDVVATIQQDGETIDESRFVISLDPDMDGNAGSPRVLFSLE
jgi:hypothetical protein